MKRFIVLVPLILLLVLVLTLSRRETGPPVSMPPGGLPEGNLVEKLPEDLPNEVSNAGIIEVPAEFTPEVAPTLESGADKERRYRHLTDEQRAAVEDIEERFAVVAARLGVGDDWNEAETAEARTRMGTAFYEAVAKILPRDDLSVYLTTNFIERNKSIPWWEPGILLVGDDFPPWNIDNPSVADYAREFLSSASLAKADAPLQINQRPNYPNAALDPAVVAEQMRILVPAIRSWLADEVLLSLQAERAVTGMFPEGRSAYAVTLAAPRTSRAIWAGVTHGQIQSQLAAPLNRIGVAQIVASSFREQSEMGGPGYSGIQPPGRCGSGGRVRGITNLRCRICSRSLRRLAGGMFRFGGDS